MTSLTMSKKIKFTYFDGFGRGELSRLILAYAGVAYEDVRIKMAEWPALKATMPLGVMPVLDYDGEIISQSKTIARFLAKEFGIAGKTNLQQAKADMIVDCVTDIEIARYKWCFATDPSFKQAEKKAFENEHLPRFLGQMLTVLNQGKGKFMTGDELTWADIAIANLMDLCLIDVNIDKGKFQKLYSLKNQVSEVPNIKKYLATRPKSAA